MFLPFAAPVRQHGRTLSVPRPILTGVGQPAERDTESPDPESAPGALAPPGEAGDLDRILTIPNLITLVRLLCLPLYWWLLFSQHNPFGAAVLLGALGATDWCDGYIARHFNQVSNLGKVFDPTADRFLFFVAIVGIIIAGAAPLWLCWVVLAREIVVGGTTVIITALGAKPVDVTWFGKAGTFCLMFAFPLFLAGSSDVAVAPALTALGAIMAVPGVVFSYYAAFRYVPKWRENLRAARQARHASA